uniref:Uncharacterized protein n=1 Tax=Oryza meridionalis TaxID=40149 RepID=A0A0E0D0Z9_9ORYZ
MCYGGRGNSDAPTVIRIEAWGARSSTSTLGLVVPGFTTNGSTSGLVEHANVPMEGAHLSVFLCLFFLLLPPVFFLLLFCWQPREKEERASGAPALQWPKYGDAGGNTCSRATRSQGGWLPVKGAREETGTAAARACSGR